jgi:uncharacterized protein YdeI (YjbR/CyaY-like superfamily)
MDVQFFASPSMLRAWLEENHARATELQIGFYKTKSGRAGISYAEALDEVLCFGWIDGVRKSIDAGSYTIRFSPRKPGSTWSSVNVKRAGELAQLGLMQPAGLQAFNERDQDKSNQYSYERSAAALDSAYEQQFRANAKAWHYFQSQAPSYQKTASWWVMSAKREETRQKRLATLISDSAQGERLPHLTYKAKA